jgi:hypothetical protein
VPCRVLAQVVDLEEMLVVIPISRAKEQDGATGLEFLACPNPLFGVMAKELE